MRILISGAGRGGTYLLKAAVESFGNVRFAKGEDKEFFKRPQPDNYGAKLTTENDYLNCANLKEKLDWYPDLKILFSSRHPVDILLSRLWRGQNLTRDGIERSIEAITFFHQVLVDITNMCPDKVRCIKMKDLIVYPGNTMAKIANFLGWANNDHGDDFVKFANHKRHIERYGHKLDKTQINTHLQPNAYAGFFSERQDVIEEAKQRLAHITKSLGY